MSATLSAVIEAEHDDEPRWNIPRPSRRDAVAEAMRRRIKERLFGEAQPEVWIGRFRVLETLGQGGMGIVYAADDVQLERRVALKVIRDDRLREGDRARLLREARLQAKLSDPHVVQVHEVSEYERGLFIVMELVRGPTLRQWLDHQVRPLPAIVERFVEAARGLSAAHRAGIVHRDFKPTNALVGEDGRVRLVDFGLALGSAAQPELSTEGAVHPGESPTPSGTRRVGTPIYMSPEQVLGADCDARSDQYSFSVALAEALFGRPPAPARHRLSHETPAAGLPADRRVPRWLREALARGLALRPEERFPSMQAMIDALVEVPRRRRRWFAAAGVGLALASATAVGASVRGGGEVAQVCPDPREHLAGVWDDDRRQALLAAFTATHLGFAEGSWRRTTAALDDYAERWAAARRDNCEATRVRGEQSERMFDRSAQCLERARATWTTLLDVLVAADVAIVAHAEELVAGLPAPEECRAPELPADVAERRAGGEELAALLERARILVRTGQGGQAAAVLADGLTRLRAAGDAAGEAEALLWLGRAQGQLLSDGTGAAQTLHLAYDRAAAAGRTDLTWEIWGELAYVHARLLDAPAEARIWLAHADSSRPRSSAVADAALLTVEAEILAAEGRDEESLAPRQAALARLQAHHPAGHPDVTRARMSLAAGLGDADHNAESREQYARLFAELAGQYGADHPWPARAELNLGLALLDLGELAQARVHLEHARRVVVATYGSVHRSVATVDVGLAQVDAAEGQLARAIARGEQALAGYDATLPRTHASRVTALVLLSGLYLESGQIEPQLRVSRELLAIHDLGGGRRDFDLPGVLTNVGNGLCDLGRCGEALPYFTRLSALFSDRPPEDPTFAAVPLRGIGLVHAARGEPALALVFLEQAHELLKGADERGGIAELRAATARELADVLATLGRSPERVKQLRRLAADLSQ